MRVHVRPAERIDRLLGVPDEHQTGGTVAEGLVDDFPLHAVGVLELVDQDYPVALAQAKASTGATLVVKQSMGQSDQQVVIGEEVPVEQAPLHLLPHPFGEAPAQPRRGRVAPVSGRLRAVSRDC